MTNDDEEICFCCHVTRRKLVGYIRRTRPTRLEDLAGCLGAGSVCGLCRKRLKEVLDATTAPQPSPGGTPPKPLS